MEQSDIIIRSSVCSLADVHLSKQLSDYDPQFLNFGAMNFSCHSVKLFLVFRCVFKIVQCMVTVNNKSKALF